jgi:predicted CopG family antitoxin
MIAVTPENYQVLKELGKTGDSFNDVLTDILKKIGALKKDA